MLDGDYLHDWLEIRPSDLPFNLKPGKTTEIPISKISDRKTGRLRPDEVKLAVDGNEVKECIFEAQNREQGEEIVHEIKSRAQWHYHEFEWSFPSDA
ncbi:hypothetical protein BU16DRAFT_525163 [Lophium mytilinum]|uniref:SIN1-type PH domain-containing protein n=1 Tax=Lophium mytilinum TaxID=390894 RepID=A0A6A6QYI7_9PEZI|nr:hypothetical protein BU16DRAFT_525163 [Lophium mytilinum]